MPSRMLEAEERTLVNMAIRKATVDEVFRKRLLSKPRAAVEEAFDVTLRKDFSIKFLEKDRDVDVVHVLPDLSNTRS